MKPFIFLCTLMASFLLPAATFGQSTELVPGKTIERKILKGENHTYTMSLRKGEHAIIKIEQGDINLTMDVNDPSGGKIGTFDYPDSVSFEARKSGKFELNIYPEKPASGWPDSIKTKLIEMNQGVYAITDILKLSASDYKKMLTQIQSDKDVFTKWIRDNAHEIKTVDAGNGFEDLQPYKSILRDVRVVGLGEATHGTSEFFRMKHRMLEFLVKEMGFTSFYIEASMTRCRYINDYVLYGIGDPDTATAIQGFVPWRVEEVKDMIGWMRQYNSSVSNDRKVKFIGFDLQVNDLGWKGLMEFYNKVNSQKLVELDSAKMKADTAITLLKESYPRMTDEGKECFKSAYLKTLGIIYDLVLNEGSYQFLTGKNVYEENLMNIKLIVQELEGYQKNLMNSAKIRDYYLAQNVMYLLNQEMPDAKVVLWAHNGHIAKRPGSPNQALGSYLEDFLKGEYYAIGFEFYSGAFQTRNVDIHQKATKDWDVMTVGAPPVESLPWYFDQTGKNKLFIDFRNTGTDKIRNFNQAYQMHELGASYGTQWPETKSSFLRYYDGMIYIKESSAAKNLTKVYLDRYN